MRRSLLWALPPATGVVPLSELETPFRQRFERACGLGLQAQLEECVDYLEHPDVLIAEFLESYYLVEGKLDPEREDRLLAESRAELVLEPYFDSLELCIRAGTRSETIRCVSGAFAPLPGSEHPALERKGVDYIGVRDGTERIVLGVVDAHGDSTVFVLLLRALNCLAELSPPFQVARLRRHVVHDRVGPEADFELQLGVPAAERSEREMSLLVLTRDLAEVFRSRISAEQQFKGTIAHIDCLELPGEEAANDGSLRLRWRA